MREIATVLIIVALIAAACIGRVTAPERTKVVEKIVRVSLWTTKDLTDMDRAALVVNFDPDWTLIKTGEYEQREAAFKAESEATQIRQFKDKIAVWQAGYKQGYRAAATKLWEGGE